MKISKIDNNTSFKAIKLNSEEIAKADNLLKTYTNTVKNNKKILDIFDSHIKKEAKQKAADKFSAKDVLQEMYLTFFEKLHENKKNKLQTKDLVKVLDDFTPADKELFISPDTIPLSAELKHTLPEIQAETKQTTQIDNISRICDKSNLQEYEKKAVLQKAQGYSDAEIFPEVSKNIASVKMENIMEKIQLANDIIPEQKAKKIELFEKKHGMHFREKDMVDVLKADNFVFSKFCNNDTLYNSVKNTSEKLQINEKDYKKLVERFPILLLKHDNNFISTFILNAKKGGMSAQNYAIYATKSPEYFFLKNKSFPN